MWQRRPVACLAGSDDAVPVPGEVVGDGPAAPSPAGPVAVGPPVGEAEPATGGLPPAAPSSLWLVQPLSTAHPRRRPGTRSRSVVPLPGIGGAGPVSGCVIELSSRGGVVSRPAPRGPGAERLSGRGERNARPSGSGR
ncbi:Tyrosine-protein kinase JAK2 [Streptomyces misionensis JCM 4497]